MHIQKVITGAILLIGTVSLAFAQTAPLPKMVNGDMSVSYQTGDSVGTLIPNGWGTQSSRGAAAIFYDTVDFVSTPASLRYEVTGDYAQGVGVSSTILNKNQGGGKVVTLSGKIKGSLDVDAVQVAFHFGCSGTGGWSDAAIGVPSWVDVVRGAPPTTWTDFEGSATFPTVAGCMAKGETFNNFTAQIQFLLTGGMGAACWLDDLVLETEGVKTLIPFEVITSAGRLITVQNNTVNFAMNANYEVSIVTTSGKQLSSVTGKGITCDISNMLPKAAGSYLIRVSSDAGMGAYPLTISK